MLIHQLPSTPAYLRVKVGRRLAKVGAVALKNSVYLLPSTDACREDFSWIRREIVDEGGEAQLLEAIALEGLSTADIERMFRDARAKDYEEVAHALHALAKERVRDRPQERQSALAELLRIEEQLAALDRIDFFPSGLGEQLGQRLLDLRAALQQRTVDPSTGPDGSGTLSRADYQKRTWVTRRGVKIDRIASAWLIQRFIDRDARFKFVDWGEYTPKAGDLCFDTPEGDFTHEGNACSFEVLCTRFALDSAELKRLAEIVHDLDIKDSRFMHPETEGIRAIIEGVIAQHERDEARIEEAGRLLDALVRANPRLSRKPTNSGGVHARHKSRAT